MSNLSQVLRTVRHLRFSQVATRVRRLLTRRRLTKIDAPDVIVFRNAPECFPHFPELSHPCATGEELLTNLEQRRLPALNQRLEMANGDEIDWRLGAVSSDRLPTITLHYHQWLYELARIAADRDDQAVRAGTVLEELLESWLKQCPIKRPGAGALAWNSYAIATRLGWSIRTSNLLAATPESRGSISPRLLDDWRRSLWQQAVHLHANLEWDLRANHLLRDAVGLAWAGRFFSGIEADRWMRTATRLALSQATEQMLPDGGHFERSPFYHLEVMDDWLSLALLLSDPAARQQMRQTWQKAAEYICWMRHPDGRVAQFNDGAAASADEHLRHGAAIGVEPDLSPRLGGKYFKDSGVVVWHGDLWAVFFDVGQIGPDYQPGHAHADSLSIEASFAGQRLLVDPGCHSYDLDERRQYDRATRSHNTVCIDGTDSSEVWHIFRVGRRARPLNAGVNLTAEGLSAYAEHSGYDHLPGRPRHHRTVEIQNDGCMTVSDRVTGQGHHRVEGGWLLAPDWSIQKLNDGWALSRGEATVKLTVSTDVPIKTILDYAPYHPDYGVEETVARISWRYAGDLPLSVDSVFTPV